MKRIIPTFLLGGFLVLSLSGCIAPPKTEFAPPEGVLFSNYKAPLMIDYDQTSINSDSGKGSCSAFQDILLTGMSFGWGDCSIDEATQAGRLNRVGVADYEYLGFLRIYGKTTVHVYESPSSIIKSTEKTATVAPVDDVISPKPQSVVAPPTAVDAATQLKKLKELKDAGILTDEEYEARRKTLVEQL